MKLKGSHGWLVVALVVSVIDLLAVQDETLSDAAHRAIKRHPVIVGSLVGSTAAHLALGHHKHWHRVDPYCLVGWIRKWTALK